MYVPLNLFPQFLAAVAASDSAGALSEAELIARYPAIAAAIAVLLSLGVICDLYLLHRFARPAPSNGQTLEASPRFKIDPKPWNMRDVLLAMAALVLVLLGGNVAVTLTLKLAHWDEDKTLPWLLGVDMLLRVVILVGFVTFFRRRSIDWCHALGLRRGSPLRSIGLGAIFFLAVLPPLAAVFTIYANLCHLAGIKDEPQPISNLLATSDSMVVVVLIAAFAVTIAPVFEEFLFRGFAYPPLKQRWGAWRALMVVSALFTAIHFHVPSMGPLFALAIGFGLAYELTGSLLAPITMHALFNATNVAMLLYVRTHP
jgi:membrane protease YdiL (CAAX protease family)